MRKTLNVVILLLVLFAALATGQDDKTEFEYEAEIAPGSTLYLSNVIGDVQITGWDKNYISILAEKNIATRYLNKYGKKLYNQMTINVKKSGKKIICDARLPKGDFRRLDKRGDHAFSIDFEIKVPRETSIQLKRMVLGTVDLDNLSGKFNLSLIKGEITANNISGSVTAHLTMGDLDFDEVHGDLNVEGSHCDIEMTKVTGNLNISTSSGEITVDAIDLDSAVINTTSADIILEVEAPLTFGTYKLTALNGDIYLGIDPSSAFNIWGKTTSGEITCAFDLQIKKELRKKYILGEINEGGAEITLSTFQGDIEIDN